jgi:oxygen-independent coproporphyrinogen-3 oxidase
MVLDGKVTMQDNDYDAGLYETTIDYLLSNDFYQYEVSNFAKPDFECVHNNAYWKYRDYLGLGTSAHSFINEKRWWNFSSLKKYIHEIELKGHAIKNSEKITEPQLHDEYVMLALRSSGLNLIEYRKKFDDSWIKKNYNYFELLKNENLITSNNDIIKLTSKGYAICDEILKNIL